MKVIRVFAAAVVSALLLTSSADAAAPPAAEVTLTGKLACALCVLKQQGVQSCINVLVVPQAGKDVVYALTDNQVTRAYEMRACDKALPIKVSGTLTEQGGKRSIVAVKIEKT